jgi:hypothetical protein
MQRGGHKDRLASRGVRLDYQVPPAQPPPVPVQVRLTDPAVFT